LEAKLLPSLYIAADKAWNVRRAAAYGAALGFAAAVFKTLGPFHRLGATVFGAVPEIVGATLGFAVLCAGASLLRNFITRKQIKPNGP
jgi:hypothetical protein